LGRRAVLQVEGSRWADGGGSLPARRIYEALGGPAPVHGDDRIGVTRLTVTTVGEPDVSRRLGMGGRLRGWGHQHTMGRLVTLTPTVVVFNPGDRDISRPLAEVSRIERVSRNVRKGALIGLVTGALLSFAIGCDTRASIARTAWHWCRSPCHLSAASA
jgi:hypothetical protein